MAELLPTQGDNTPPPLIPPPLGFAGLGDAYSGNPNVPPPSLVFNPLELPGALGAYLGDPNVREAYRNQLGSIPVLDPILRFGSDVAEQTFPPFFAQRQMAGLEDPNVPPILPGVGLAASGIKKAGTAEGALAKLAAKAPTAERYIVKDNNVINAATGMLHSAQSDAKAAEGVAQRLNAVPDIPARGLGGTGGQLPLPPEGPKFSGQQFPKDVVPGLNAIQGQSEVVGARPEISLAEQSAIADRQAIRPEGQLINELRASGPGTLSGKTIEANRRTAGMIQESAGLLDAIQNGTATDAQRAQLSVTIQSALQLRAATVGAVSEAARVTGAQGRVPIDAVLRPKDRQLLDAVGAQASKVLADPTRVDELARQIVLASATPKKLDALIGAANELPFWQKAENGFFEYYRSNVLWNVATHVTNSTSGIFQAGLYTARELATNAGAIKYTPELGKGYLQAAANILPSKWQNFLGAHVGIFEDLPQQISLTNLSDKYGGANYGRGTIPGPIGSVIRTPFRVLAAADIFQVKPLFNFFMKTEAEKLGRSTGLSGAGLRDFVNNIPPDAFNQIQEKALTQAHEAALHATGGFSRSILGLRESSFAGKLLVLFVNTPINLAKVGVRFSPLGGLRAIPAPFTEAGRARLPNIATETLIGSGITAGFLALLGSDNMTGLSPKTSGERTLWEAEGRQPMSIRATEYPLLSPLLKAVYGDKASSTWVSVNLMGPLLYPALIAGAAWEAQRSGSELTPEHAAQAAGAAGQTLLNTLPLFQQYSTINTVLSSPTDQSITRLMSNFAKPLIPAETGLAMVERMVDGFKRDPKNLQENLQQVIPGLGQQVRQDYDVLGRPITVQTGAAGLLPKATTEQPSPILSEDKKLREANVGWGGLNMPSQSIGSGANKITLDADQFNAYQKIAGEAKQQVLGALIADPKYQSLNNVEKAKKFDATEKAAQDSALRALGIGMASSTDASAVVEGARLAIATGDRYLQAKSLAAVGSHLTSGVRGQIDAARTQADPSKPGYDPTVAEYLRGNDLVTAWLRAPEFVFGNKTQWDAAATSAEQLRLLRADAVRRGVDPNTDKQIINFYVGAAGGALALFYSSAGQKRSDSVSVARQTIQQDRLWSMFSSAAGNAERP